MPNERVQTEVIPLDNYWLVGYHCSLLGSLCKAKSTDSKVGFPTHSIYLHRSPNLFTDPRGIGSCVRLISQSYGSVFQVDGSI